MTPGRRKLVTAFKILLAAAIVWFAGRALIAQWESVRETAADLAPNWVLILASSVIVLATFGVLAEAWRLIVLAWGRPLRYRSAVRIWCISSLGRYVPGKVWQLGTMAMLSQREGVSGMAAASSALIITVINTLVGFGVVAAFGLQLLEFRALGLAALGVLAAAVLFAPRLLPWASTRAGQLIGRDVTVPRLPHRTLWFGIGVSATAWVAYGIAFYLFARGLLGDVTGGLLAYIAIYTFSYLLGFLALFAPGGIVVREVAMVAALVNVGMPEGSAIVLAVVSRLWLTVLEIAPAVAFLAYDQLRRRPRNAAQESSL